MLGDTVEDTGTFYYGSYFGGVFGTEIEFTAEGAVADVAGSTLVAIDNKYEGANVVERDGYFYLFLSATNCCNGALTGYSVFVGRSSSPLGPFVDQQGQSLTDAQTGGTPYLTMNGNRWVGTGHNTVFTDAAGQWWTIYHAVDQRDPFFETEVGFTKRPALLDPVDWIEGWPTVNGGSGPSDRVAPAPAGREGQDSRRRVDRVAVQEPRRLLPAFSDDFSSRNLSPQWEWDWAGDEDDYVKLTNTSIFNTRQTEYAKEVSDVPEGWARYGNTVVGPPSEEWTHLRVVVKQLRGGERRDAGGDTESYTAYTSQDGKQWVRGGTWTHSLGRDARIGLVAFGLQDAAQRFAAEFDYVRTATLREHRPQ